MGVMSTARKNPRMAASANLRRAMGETPSIGSDYSMRQIVALLDQETRDGCPTGSAYLFHLKSAANIRIAALRNDLIVVNRPLSIQAALQSVLKELDSDPISRHSIEDMARISGYSRGHFLRSFRLLTGVPPHQYLVQSRLGRAREMIA